ncbi:AP2 domain-containing protein [Cryptosporidium felis]|nr:AP2 domain-containing protein [Cryptosporidium felis]
MPSAGSTNFHPQSGHPGVTWCSERRTWRICYAPEPGKRVTKSFNPRHYGGLEQALQAAIEYLREQKAKLSLYRPNGNSSKGENSTNVNIKKMNDKLGEIHRSSSTNVLDMDLNSKCGGKMNNSNWSNGIPYNGFDYGSGLGNSELNNINGEMLPGFEGNKTSGHMNPNMFTSENSSEQWNAAAAAVIAHAITSSKSSTVNQKRKANCDYSNSMRGPSKTTKASGAYGEHSYFSSQSSQGGGSLDMNGRGYCCECYYNGCNNANNSGPTGGNSGVGGIDSKGNEDPNSVSPNQMENTLHRVHCNNGTNGHNGLMGQNGSFHHYSCSHSTKSTISTSVGSNSGNGNNIHPFIYDYGDQTNVNDLMNIRTPKYVNYQRHSVSQNLDDDLLHPSIASSSPLGKVFQSTPYSNIDNYDNLLTPNMRSGNSQNHSSGLNIGHNSGRYYGNGNIYEGEGGVPGNSAKSNGNIGKGSYSGNNNPVSNNSGNNGNNTNNGSGTYSSCNSCISNPVQNEFGDFNSPYSAWFEGLGSCYSEIEDTFLSKGSHLLPIGSLGPYSFQPYKEQSPSEVGGKSIVESILLPLSTTSCGTSTEPQLSNDLTLDSCQNTNLFQHGTNINVPVAGLAAIPTTGNANKNVCLTDTSPIQ